MENQLKTRFIPDENVSTGKIFSKVAKHTTHCEVGANWIAFSSDSRADFQLALAALNSLVKLASSEMAESENA